MDWNRDKGKQTARTRHQLHGEDGAADHQQRLRQIRPLIRMNRTNLRNMHRICGGDYDLMNNLAAGYGDYVISAYGVAGKITSMVFMITVGYVSGYMPFAGYNYGAGRFKRMVSALKFTMLTATGVCLFLLIPLLSLAPHIMRAFTRDRQIIETGIRFLHAQAVSVPLLGVQMTLMSTFQATGRAVPALIVNLGRQCLFYIPLLYLLNSAFQAVCLDVRPANC